MAREAHRQGLGPPVVVVSTADYPPPVDRSSQSVGDGTAHAGACVLADETDRRDRFPIETDHASNASLRQPANRQPITSIPQFRSADKRARACEPGNFETR